MDRLAWIAVDWGTSNLRAWAMGSDNRVLDDARSDKGMGSLDRAGFEPALMEVIGDWLSSEPVIVIACGMVGSRQGWVEAGYRDVPCAPISDAIARAETRDPRLRVFVVPGLRQNTPADVMRGEETQIAGFLASDPDFDGVLCLPGTHTKWAHISAGEVVSFRTAMTGDLYAALSEHSILRHTVTEDWDSDAFDDAVGAALSRPEALAQTLFSIRAEGLIRDDTRRSARARLSGTLIGAELATARPYWLGQQVALVGDARVEATYGRALAAQGAPPRLVDADKMTRAGLARLREGLQETMG